MYGFKGRKAAQTAAYFAIQQGGAINVLKLAKLLYLAERESMSRFDEPLFYDRLVSMDHGPVASISLDLINGLSQDTNWDTFIKPRDGHMVPVGEGITFSNLDELSKADLTILSDLWEKFSAFDRYEIRDWTHVNCPEWDNPKGSSEPINHSIVFKFLNKPNASELADDISDYRNYVSSLEGC